MTVSPTAACRVTDSLSLGVGLDLLYGYLSIETAINKPDPGLGDGKREFSESEPAIGANLGLLCEFTGRTQAGVQYTTPRSLDFQIRSRSATWDRG